MEFKDAFMLLKAIEKTCKDIYDAKSEIIVRQLENSTDRQYKGKYGLFSLKTNNAKTIKEYTEEEKVELQTIEKDIVIGVDTDGLYNERSDYQKIALFKYFIIDYLNRAEPKKQNIDVYYDYKKGYATINNKLFLISKLIKYIYNYGIKWSGVDLKKLYNNRDCLKNNIKDYDIRTENDVERYLKSLTDKRHLKP